MALTLAELAQRFGGSIRGDGGCVLRGVANLNETAPDRLAFLANSKYRAQLERVRVGAVLLTAADAEGFHGNAWIVTNPRLVFARAAALLHAPPPLTPGVHASASIDPTAHIAASARIDAKAVVESGACIGERAHIGAGCYIGANAAVGDDTRLAPNVTLMNDCRIGARGVVHSGVVIGSDGFGFVPDQGHWVKIPQLGRVVIGDDVEIGANTAIDRGTLGDTVIGNGVKLDNLIQVAHNVEIGDDCAMAGCVGIAGSAKFGRRCTVAGGAGIVGHIEVGDDVHVGPMSMLSHSVKEPSTWSAAMPAMPAAEWRRNAARVRQLDDWARRLKSLEQKLLQLMKGSSRE